MLMSTEPRWTFGVLGGTESIALTVGCKSFPGHTST